MKVKLHCVQLFATPWTVTYQALPSMGFSRQEYWSGLPFPPPGDLPNPGIESGSPTLHTESLLSELLESQVKVKSLSRVQLCDPMDCSLPGFSVHGIFQARVPEWVAISFSGDLPDPGIEPVSPALEGRFFTTTPLLLLLLSHFSRVRLCATP